MAVHLNLTVIAIIGIMLPIRIVKKNGIMLVDFARQIEREEKLDPEECIYRACTLRFRSILMTTMAALGGIDALAGNGAELHQPLGHITGRPADVANSDALRRRWSSCISIGSRNA